MGEVVTLEASGLADGPDALCLADGYVVFVAGALPGERVRARVTQAGRKHGRAELLDVLAPSPHRVPPRCKHFGTCGGCHLQSLDPPEQARLKAASVAKVLAHRLGLAPADLPMVPMATPADPYGQRTKIALMLAPDPRRHLVYGLYARRSQRIVPLEMCPVSNPAGLTVAVRVAEALRASKAPVADPATGAPGLRAVVVRAANGTNERHVLYVGTSSAPPDEARLVRAALDAGAASAAWNVNPEAGSALLGRETRVLHGPPRLREVVAGRTYLVSPGAFFQTSAWGVTHLVEAVRARVPAEPEADLVDLYCGGGLLTLALADRCRRAVGLEGNPHAVEDARASARAAGVQNVEFVAGRVEARVRELSRRVRAATVVLDPPREGCGAEVIAAVTEALRPRRLIYVSCEPQALARDAVALRDAGYGLVEVAPFDMFPHTFHVETIATFEPQSAPRTKAPQPRKSS